MDHPDRSGLQPGTGPVASTDHLPDHATCQTSRFHAANTIHGSRSSEAFSVSEKAIVGIVVGTPAAGVGHGRGGPVGRELQLELVLAVPADAVQRPQVGGPVVDGQIQAVQTAARAERREGGAGSSPGNHDRACLSLEELEGEGEGGQDTFRLLRLALTTGSQPNY